MRLRSLGVFLLSLICSTSLWAGVVGLRYTDYTLVWDKVPSIETQYRSLLDLFTVLMLPDQDLYVDLRWDRTLSSQIPGGLFFSRIGNVLVTADYRLKEEIRKILSDVTDKEILNFWQGVISGDVSLPPSIRVRVEFAPGEMFVLSDGILIKDAELQVLVGSENERLNDILKSRLEHLLRESEEFSRLRDIARVILLGQKLKELSVIKNKKIKFSSFFGRRKLLGLNRGGSELLKLVRSYLSLKTKPISIHLRGYEINISGTIDFSGILPQIKEEEVDISVEDAIEKLGMFGIGRPPRIKPNSLNTDSIITDWQREVDLEPFWKILTILRRTRSQNLVACAFGFPITRRVKLGKDILVRYFVEEARRIFSDLGKDVDFLSSLSPDKSVKTLARFDPDSVNPSELADKLYGFIKLGYLVFTSGMEKGWVVGVKVNGVSRLFFSSLLSENKAYLKYVLVPYRDEFEWAVKEVKADYMDPFEQELRLLELVSTYHSVLDHRIQDPWPFIYFSIRKLAGVDPFSGLAISL